MSGKSEFSTVHPVRVDEARQVTASARRATIIREIERNLGHSASPPRAEFADRLGRPHTVVAGSDIDGLVSSAMLASVSEWRVGVLVDRSRDIYVAPHIADLDAWVNGGADIYGVDVFSMRFPSVSNHPLMFGTTNRSPQKRALRTLLADFDEEVREACRRMGSLNLSAWAGIGARFDASSECGLPYKYPLGSAQIVLAALEVVGRAPRMYDRQYTPWLIANCDGGLTSIRTYPWNVENWWSALAAVAGPASLSESLYRLATGQRPTEFIDVDRRLRYDEPERSKSLNSRWNITSSSMADLQAVTELLCSLTGWPDPFAGGAGSLSDWKRVQPTRGILSLASKAASGGQPAVRGIAQLTHEEVTAHLDGARGALHANFSNFKERGIALGWLLTQQQPAIEDIIGRLPEDAVEGEDDEDEQEVTGVGPEDVTDDKPPSA